MPHKFEKRPPTVKEYTENYKRWSEQLRENARRITESSECRKFLVKNAATAPLEDLLIEAVLCIYDLTGDEQVRKQVISTIEERRKG